MKQNRSATGATTSRHQQQTTKEKPVSLTQPNLKVGFKRVHYGMAIAGSVLSAWAVHTYCFTLLGLTGIQGWGAWAVYMCGVGISDLSIIFIIRAFDNGEIVGKDVKKARLLLRVALIDVMLGMLAKATPEMMPLFFGKFMPVLTIIQFWLWQDLGIFGLLATSVREIAGWEVKVETANKKMFYQAQLNRTAEKEKEMVKQDGQRRIAVRSMELFVKEFVEQLESKKGQQMVKDIAVQKVSELLGGGVSTFNDLVSQEGSKTKSGNEFLDFSSDIEPAQVSGNTGRKKKRTRTTCKGCGAKLPETFDDKPWTRDFCPEDRPGLSTYGESKSACKKAAQKKTRSRT